MPVMGPRALALGIVACVIGMCATPASAAFPGRDGKLVVATGTGLELVAPATGAAIAICTNATLCGRPTQPRFSPNGRAITFIDATSHRLVVVAAGGSCLWCLLGARLTTISGTRPAFTADAQSATIARSGLWSVPLTVGRARRVVTGAVEDAVWSARGLVAVVRGGWIWVGRPGRGKLRRLARGRLPSFSPDGARLAVVRGGYVWVVRVADGRARRLVRGGAPAWSPSGGRIAYLAPGGAVEVIGVSGGRPRRVGVVNGTALDWQPLVRPARQSCAPPRGATVLASSPEAIVFSQRPASSSGQPVFYGCLWALGRTRVLLDTAQAGYFYRLVAVRLAGRFAALEPWFDSPEYISFGASVYDLSTGHEEPLGGVGWDWNVQPLVGGVDSLTLDSSGFAAWRETTGPQGQGITALSCPSASLCVAGDGGGDILSSADPRGGPTAWSRVPALSQQSIAAVSCASIALCAAVGVQGDILTSTNPAGGAGAWAKTTPGSGTHLHAIACPSASLCVAGGGGATAHPGSIILTSTDPTGGANAWRGTQIAAGDELVNAVACPSVSLCLAATNTGDVFTSTSPTVGASAWTKVAVDPGISFNAISCPSVSLCIAIDNDIRGYGIGSILATASPAGGAGAWSKSTIERGAQYHPGTLGPLSCPSVALCVAVDSAGTVFTSRAPTGGASAWTKATVDQGNLFGNGLEAVSCPSVSLCVAGDESGRILTSTAPSGGATTWTSRPVAFPGCPPPEAPCVSEQLFARDDNGIRTIDRAPSGGGSVIGDVALTGDALTLTWTHDGVANALTLR